MWGNTVHFIIGWAGFFLNRWQCLMFKKYWHHICTYIKRKIRNFICVNFETFFFLFFQLKQVKAKGQSSILASCYLFRTFYTAHTITPPPHLPISCRCRHMKYARNDWFYTQKKKKKKKLLFYASSMCHSRKRVIQWKCNTVIIECLEVKIPLQAQE